MPGRVGRSAEANQAAEDAAKAKAKRGKREDQRLADMAKVELYAEAPVKPKGMDKVASQHWDYLVELLVPLRLLTRIDGPKLEMLCTAHMFMERAKKKIKNTMVKSVSGGSEHVSAWNRIYKEHRADYDKISEQFGMSPTSRTRMRIPLPKVKQDERTSTEDDEFFKELS